MPIHTYKYKEEYILLDINSSAVFSIDEITFDILKYYKKFNKEEIICKFDYKYSKEEILEVILELDTLVKNNVLYTKEKKIDKSPYEGGVIKAMCLHISHDCNLACRYCFASGGDFNTKKELMSLETAKGAIDFLIKNSGNRYHLEVDFFGGEPLMNYDVVKECVAYARVEEKKYNKKFRFTMTTNALLIDDEKIEFFNKEMDNVVLSIDGRKEVNDYTRPTINNKGSYELIIENIKKVAFLRHKLKKDYYIRGTYTAYALDFEKDVEHLASLGLKNISMEPVVALEENDYAIKSSHIEMLKDSYDKLLDIYLKNKGTDKEFSFFHFNMDLDNDKCEYKKIAGCGAGCEYISVTPNGDVYPCHQFVGDNKFNLGHINDSSLNEDLRKDFYSCTLQDNKNCEDCFSKYFCSGGCLANNYNFNNDINIPYETGCELLKKRVECGLYLYIKSKKTVDK